MRERMYDPAKPVACYRGPHRYDAEVQIHWVGKQWMVKANCASYDGAISIAQAAIDLLHTKIEEMIVEEMKPYKQAKE